MPATTSVAVTDEAAQLWLARGGSDFESVLSSGAVALIDASYLIEQSERPDGVMLPRQALPDAAFVSLSELKAAQNPFPFLRIACCSHCWLQPDHPDPRGHNLRAVGRALKLLVKSFGRFAVFIDFMCIHQRCRGAGGAPQPRTHTDEGGRYPAEDVLFKRALGSLGAFYSHPETFVFMLTAFPPDYDDPARYRRSGNTAPYPDRGWCFCEASWAALVKDSRKLLDLGLDTGEKSRRAQLAQCRQRRRAPLPPDEFAAALESKGFTNGKCDRPLVADLYRAGFAERFAAAARASHCCIRPTASSSSHSCAVLEFVDLGWGGAEAAAIASLMAAGALAPCEKLSLNWNGNGVGDRGVEALAAAVAADDAPASLARLSLRRHAASEAAAVALGAACAAKGVTCVL
ncbi:hypothetical protein EMIHUDRAFT_455013 [Emiliania huxleyi CCMP1516]|uniref:Uncharacterized protein n=2 Tax=Emiliania huxleyi TaxID=2903 RepID=A0A0D3KLK0_EMIH1|nr:hypothetical protein EMIHUDRAFT_455013 [Emiliania huxleyi CCMP1516]EOD36635.1 hypothetical protein EMIHUDRAFT_455013 [Emiliania huxleyi CCMP1516]|eukprot:XP_005789064.1 hypothetical protein EMIHUDRAFT_455013 [Emiliania huxleyi CCMP1516]